MYYTAFTINLIGTYFDYIKRVLSAGMLLHAVQRKFTDVLEEHAADIFSVRCLGSCLFVFLPNIFWTLKMDAARTFQSR
jgi:hypothetical protein